MTESLLQHPVPYAGLLAITGGETLLILVPGPGDESLGCGGLIAESCRRGRPPFVMVLGDGTLSDPPSADELPDQRAALHDRETRAAIACLGLPRERLLMAGIYDGHIPAEGAAFDVVVRAVTLVMWSRDCNVICAPWPEPATGVGQEAVWRIAEAVAERSGVGLLAYAAAGVRPRGPARRWRLDIGTNLAAKRAAVAAHASRSGQVIRDDYEVFLKPAAHDLSVPGALEHGPAL